MRKSAIFKKKYLKEQKILLDLFYKHRKNRISL